MMATLWQGNYLGGEQKDPGGWDFVTLVHFVGELGECRVRVFEERELPFKPNWKPMSLRGYHKCAEVPAAYAEHPSVAPRETDVVRWNYRMPENGAVFLCYSREARDANLLAPYFVEAAQQMEGPTKDGGDLCEAVTRVTAHVLEKAREVEAKRAN